MRYIHFILLTMKNWCKFSEVLGKNHLKPVIGACINFTAVLILYLVIIMHRTVAKVVYESMFCDCGYFGSGPECLKPGMYATRAGIPNGLNA